MKRTCSIECCSNAHKALGYCNKHYTQYRRGAVLTVNPERTERAPMDAQCEIEGCNRLNGGRNRRYCGMHYQRLFRGQDMYAPARYERLTERDPTCRINGCDRETRAKGYCQTHYRRLRQGKDLYAPVKTHRPCGTTVEDVKWLLECGIRPWEISDQLGRSVGGIATAARAAGEMEIARQFWRIDSRLREGRPLEDHVMTW